MINKKRKSKSYANYHAKRLVAIVMAISMFSIIFSSLPSYVSNVSAASNLYTYTVDIFNYNPGSPPQLNDLLTGGGAKFNTTNTIHTEGFYRMTFTDTRDRVVVHAQNSMSSSGPFGNGHFVMTSEYAHVYLVGGASANDPNTSNPAIVYYMSATQQGKIKLTAIKAQPQQALRMIYWDQTKREDIIIDYAHNSQKNVALSGMPELIPPSATSSQISSLRVFSAETNATFNPGDHIWFLARTAYGSSASSQTLFSTGTSQNSTSSSKKARFTMPSNIYSADLYITGLNMQPGANESRRNFTWQSNVQNAGFLKIWKNGSPQNTNIFHATVQANMSPRTSYLSNKTTVVGLEPGTTYHYKVTNICSVTSRQIDSPTYTFTTDISTSNFTFLLAGDPQMSAGSALSTSMALWQNTLDRALSAWPGTSFIASTGDQVSDADSIRQWDGFLSPDQLRTIPFASSNGNHDFENYGDDGTVSGLAQYPTYLAHFNLPNMSDYPHPIYGGGHYWYSYGDALFIHINTGQVQQHQSSYPRDWNQAHTFATNAIAEFTAQRGKAPDWKIVVMHHALYSATSRFNSNEAIEMRNAFANRFSSLDIDLVLNGHDHSYTRTHMMKNGSHIPSSGSGTSYTKLSTGETLYISAGSSTNRLYTTISGLSHVAYRYQGINRPIITKVDVAKNSLTIGTHYSDVAITGGSLIDSFTLIKP